MNPIAEIEVAELKKEVASVVNQANALIVSNPEQAQEAFNIRKSIKTWQKKVEDFFEPHKKRAKAVHAGLCDDEKKELSPALQALSVIDSKLSQYEETRRIEAERLQREADAKARKEAEDRALAEAEALEKAGEKEQAAQVLAEPVNVPIQKPIVAPKMEGGHYRTDYFGSITDKAAFLVAAAKDPSLHALIEVPQGALNRYAAATKGAVKIPGVVFGSKSVPVGR